MAGQQQVYDTHTLTLLACILGTVDKRRYGNAICGIANIVPRSDVMLYVLSLFMPNQFRYPAGSVLHLINTVVANRQAMINLLLSARVHTITAGMLDAALLHLVTCQTPGMVALATPDTQTL